MKKEGMMMAVAMAASTVMANYTAFIGQNNDPAAPFGALVDDANWDGGTMPSGSSTGLVYTTGGSVWAGTHQNLAVRQTGGYVVGGGGNMTLRGGTSGSGITTVYEIEDARTSYASYTNVYVSTKLTLWSQYGEDIEFSLLSGNVQVGDLALATSVKASINVRDGIFHADTMSNASGEFNLLAGGSGEAVIDSLESGGLGNFILNFETGNTGSFTFGSVDTTNAAGASITWMVQNNRVLIDGVADTDLASYSIVNNGLGSTISLIPEPTTLGLVGLIGGGIFTIRRFFAL